MIPFIDLAAQQRPLRRSIDRRIAGVLDHGQYIMGPEVAELEAWLATRSGSKHCVTVGSGTDALLVAMMALGIGPGDEVITTPFTFVATAEMIVLAGATPVFADVDPVTANIEPRAIERAITPKTRAIMPVSLYGQTADMGEINDMAARHGGLSVIEDAAQSFGATYRGQQSCGLSTIGCTSFFPSKPLGCYGDGGALFTSDDALATAMREIRVHGQSRRYVHTRLGIGGRMDTLQCAIVLAKAERFDWEVKQRQIVAGRYHDLLRRFLPQAQPVRESDVGQALQHPLLLSTPDDRTNVYAQFTILVPNRSEVQARLRDAGVPTAVHYPVPLHRQPAYVSYAPRTDAPVSDWLAETVMSLPMGPDLGEREQERVVDALAQVCVQISPA